MIYTYKKNEEISKPLSLVRLKKLITNRLMKSYHRPISFLREKKKRKTFLDENTCAPIDFFLYPFSFSPTITNLGSIHHARNPRAPRLRLVRTRNSATIACNYCTLNMRTFDLAFSKSCKNLIF